MVWRFRKISSRYRKKLSKTK